MLTWIYLITLMALILFGYWLGQRRAVRASGGRPVHLHSLPSYYGLYVALWAGLPSAALAIAWIIAEPHIAEWAMLQQLPAEKRNMTGEDLQFLVIAIKKVAAGYEVIREVTPAMKDAAAAYNRVNEMGQIIALAAAIGLAVVGLGVGHRFVTPHLPARNRVERVITLVMIAASTIAILTTAGIVLSLLFEAVRFFGRVSPLEFFTALSWNPQTAIREGQVAAEGSFGFVPLFAGTMLITVVAMLVATPIGLFSAVYLSDYAPKRMRALVKPIMEVLAGVPTVVYGFFAALTVAPLVRDTAADIGLNASSESALAAGLVMGIMIIPFVSSLSDDVMNAVPQALRDGAYAMGATQAETIKQVVFPAALPGIVGALLLAISRAIGETMIVVMAAGLAANLTANPLNAVTTVTVQIVALLTGDQAFDSAKTLSAFALGITLFAVTLLLNVIALNVVRRYREKYE
ncbi:phosphate ABC transporter membrane protein 1, PhoT family [Limimonas halophila]|uniref:Phosphate transport system permease protein n=1 Tax=Limimonas halophila TaxID=1082479 RepID=A0A1G7S5F4_9PROT|nr:phosphate ABC transporter permease subunit PstC [Limimonas halophila]SDG18184.1 phosphate ABC transporter membrane protein 1, PhoT family [Limimonas halophila]